MSANEIIPQKGPKEMDSPLSDVSTALSELPPSPLELKTHVPAVHTKTNLRESYAKNFKSVFNASEFSVYKDYKIKASSVPKKRSITKTRRPTPASRIKKTDIAVVKKSQENNGISGYEGDDTTVGQEKVVLLCEIVADTRKSKEAWDRIQKISNRLSKDGLLLNRKMALVVATGQIVEAKVIVPKDLHDSGKFSMIKTQKAKFGSRHGAILFSDLYKALQFA